MGCPAFKAFPAVAVVNLLANTPDISLLGLGFPWTVVKPSVHRYERPFAVRVCPLHERFHPVGLGHDRVLAIEATRATGANIAGRGGVPGQPAKPDVALLDAHGVIYGLWSVLFHVECESPAF